MLDTPAWGAIHAEFLKDKELCKHPEWTEGYPRKLVVYYLKTIGQEARYFTLDERVARAEYRVWRDMWGQDRPESKCPATNPSVQDHVVKSIEREAFEHSQSVPNRPILPAHRRSKAISTRPPAERSLPRPKSTLPETFKSEAEERMKELKAMGEEMKQRREESIKTARRFAQTHIKLGQEQERT